MICETSVLSYCKDYTKIENYDKAIADTTQTWHCHHRLETHKYKDRSRTEWVKRDEIIGAKTLIEFGVYYDRPASELIFMTAVEHLKLHNTGKDNGFFGRKHTEETRERLSESAKKRPPISDEVRKKMSESHKGRKPWNTGKKLSSELRKKLGESRIGIYWWNNGEINKKSRECPGEGWVRGRIIPWKWQHIRSSSSQD